MMNKDRVHEDLGEFLGVLEIWYNRMMNCVEKLGILVFYLKEDSKKNPHDKKAHNLDQNSHRNQWAKSR